LSNNSRFSTTTLNIKPETDLSLEETIERELTSSQAYRRIYRRHIPSMMMASAVPEVIVQESENSSPQDLRSENDDEIREQVHEETPALN